jgi:hypothetical protein
VKMTVRLLAELDREAVGIRNTLQRVREGKMTGEIYCRLFPGHNFNGPDGRFVPENDLGAWVASGLRPARSSSAANLLTYS